jgi:hypothetical protein
MRNRDQILLEAAYDDVNRNKLNALKKASIELTVNPVSFTKVEKDYIIELLEHYEDTNRNGNEIDELDIDFEDLFHKIKTSPESNEEIIIALSNEEKRFLQELFEEHKEIFVKYGDETETDYENDISFLDNIITKLENAYEQIVEGRTLHTFEDWVNWIMTVQKGQAVTFTKSQAYEDTRFLDQPGSVIGNFDNADGPLREEDLLAKKPITAWIEYEDANGNRQNGHVSIYSIRQIGSRGPRYR